MFLRPLICLHNTLRMMLREKITWNRWSHLERGTQQFGKMSWRVVMIYTKQKEYTKYCSTKICLGLVLSIISINKWTGRTELAPTRRCCSTWTAGQTRLKTTETHQESAKPCVQVGITSCTSPRREAGICAKGLHTRVWTWSSQIKNLNTGG